MSARSRCVLALVLFAQTRFCRLYFRRSSTNRNFRPLHDVAARFLNIGVTISSIDLLFALELPYVLLVPAADTETL